MAITASRARRLGMSGQMLGDHARLRPTLMMLVPRPRVRASQMVSAISFLSSVESRSVSETMAITMPSEPEAKSQSISRSACPVDGFIRVIRGLENGQDAAQWESGQVHDWIRFSERRGAARSWLHGSRTCRGRRRRGSGGGAEESRGFGVA